VSCETGATAHRLDPVQGARRSGAQCDETKSDRALAVCNCCIFCSKLEANASEPLRLLIVRPLGLRDLECCPRAAQNGGQAKSDTECPPASDDALPAKMKECPQDDDAPTDAYQCVDREFERLGHERSFRKRYLDLLPTETVVESYGRSANLSIAQES